MINPNIGVPLPDYFGGSLGRLAQRKRDLIEIETYEGGPVLRLAVEAFERGSTLTPSPT